MKELLDAISTFGFPTVVAAYLLFRQEKKIDDLCNLIKQKDGIIDKQDDILKEIKSFKKRKK